MRSLPENHGIKRVKFGTGEEGSCEIYITGAQARARARTHTHTHMLVIKHNLCLVKLCHAVAQLVEALRYKPECRGFNSRWCQWNFSLTILPAAL